VLSEDFLKNYSACWRSKKVLVNTSDAAHLVSGQNRVVIVSSVTAKIFNLASVGWSQFDLYEWCSRFNQYSLLLFVASYFLFVFCSVLFEFIQCSIRFYCSVVILFGKYFSSDPGNVFQVFWSRKQQPSAVNKHHTPDGTIFVLV
jgi:hypothetical protein